MQTTGASLLIVGADAAIRRMANAAAEKALPRFSAVYFPTVDEALATAPAAGSQVLLLVDAPPESWTKIAEATDDAGLPRWSVVAIGAAAPAKEEHGFVARDEVSLGALTVALREAVARHALLRASQRARGDLRSFARRVSHELRTPLGCVITAAEVLNESLHDGDGSRAELVRPILDSADEMVHLIDRVRFIADASAAPVRPELVNMGSVVWGTLERLEMKILERGATVIQSDHWPQVRGVPTWLDVVWTNLVENALRFGGNPPRIELGWDQEEGAARFWVRDNGTGVAPENRRTLFLPFHLLHQLDAGRGLGLPIVQRLIEMQNGRCGYEPLTSGGSRFFFTLPVAVDAR